jgi:outer membrane immunogenic protein
VFTMSRFGSFGAAVAGTVMLGLAGPLHADGVQRGGEKVDAPFSWTGFYAGVSAGAGYGQIDKAVHFASDNPTGAGNFFLNGIFTDDPTSGLNAFSRALFNQGFVGGGQLGYNLQFARTWVVGLEADIQSGVQGSGSVTGNVDPGPVGTDTQFTLTASQDLKWFGTVRGRLGFATERFLMFGTAGLAYGRTDVSANMTNPSAIPLNPPGLTTILSCPANQVCLAGADTRTSIGWTVGGGLEWALWNHVMLKVEYLHVDLGDQTVRLVAPNPANGNGFLTAKFDNSFDIARGGLNVKF